MAHVDDIRKYTKMDAWEKDIIWSSLSRDEFRRINHLCNAKLIWDRISDVYEGHRTYQYHWFLDFKESLKPKPFDLDSSSSATCLMAQGTRQLGNKLAQGESDENWTPSYSKLANIATRQQTAMEKIKIY